MLSSRKAATLTLTAASLSVPATAAADDWYRPAQREAGSGPAHTVDDARTPDAVDASHQAGAAPQTTRIVEVPTDGFVLADAAIGGAATLAVVVLVAAGGTMRLRRRSTGSLQASQGGQR